VAAPPNVGETVEMITLSGTPAIYRWIPVQVARVEGDLIEFETAEGQRPMYGLTDEGRVWRRRLPASARVSEHVAAYALGLYTYDPELSWDSIATIVERCGMGRHSAAELSAAADLVAVKLGSNRSHLAALVRATRKKG
jgi:hypothetical protein